MKYCTQCGAGNTDEAAFCSQCGVRLVSSQPDSTSPSGPGPVPEIPPVPEIARPESFGEKQEPRHCEQHGARDQVATRLYQEYAL